MKCPLKEHFMEMVGPLQIRIMHLVWKDNKPVTVHSIHSGINAWNAKDGTKALAYTTILTVMRNLSRRGFLKQTAGPSRAHIFTPMVPATMYKQMVVEHLINDVFSGNVDELDDYVGRWRTVNTTKLASLKGAATPA